LPSPGSGATFFLEQSVHAAVVVNACADTHTPQDICGKRVGKNKSALDVTDDEPAARVSVHMPFKLERLPDQGTVSSPNFVKSQLLLLSVLQN
jgi:hypothetical protein